MKWWKWARKTLSPEFGDERQAHKSNLKGYRKTLNTISGDEKRGFMCCCISVTRKKDTHNLKWTWDHAKNLRYDWKLHWERLPAMTEISVKLWESISRKYLRNQATGYARIWDMILHYIHIGVSTSMINTYFIHRDYIYIYMYDVSACTFVHVSFTFRYEKWFIQNLCIPLKSWFSLSSTRMATIHVSDYTWKWPMILYLINICGARSISISNIAYYDRHLVPASGYAYPLSWVSAMEMWFWILVLDRI